MNSFYPIFPIAIHYIMGSFKLQACILFISYERKKAAYLPTNRLFQLFRTRQLKTAHTLNGSDILHCVYHAVNGCNADFWIYL